ncbi:muramoyltetrapeptide carboxypeptidase [Glycomyces sambucus]|uniref:Muramoyltetrapeptide carboxypeptidase n=1 Tax=Glycomyces sambucus TaxID=380244 RepID=A0A1G9KEI1_9ACTN|nr:LD-carboxypeptidase [Glycomyces sambucus]SDL48270.1 muramoyltetrapeptide carboxypeptidase [Glycomyces sambucus]
MQRHPSLSRRALIGGLAAGAVAAAATASPAAAKGPRRPKKLVPGDLVVVPAPGGPSTAAAVARGVAVLEGWGLRVELTEHALDTFGYLSAPDADRLADLNYALAHPEAKALMTVRGGYGTTRIIDDADVEALEDHPKLVIGYSDITALHLAVAEQTRVPTLHSPMMAWSSNNTPATAESLRRAVMTADPVVLERDPAEPTAPVEVPGTATGKLLGGNLSLLAAEPDRSNWPDMDGAILLIEEVEEARYRVDNMLTRVIRAGHFDGLAGIAVGQFVPHPLDQHKPGEWTMNEVITDRLGTLGVPVLGGLKIGHGPDPRVVPLGTEAVLDTAAGTLTVEAAVKD